MFIQKPTKEWSLKDRFENFMDYIFSVAVEKEKEDFMRENVKYCVHQCTGECQETKECPCVNDHLCKNGVIVQE